MAALYWVLTTLYYIGIEFIAFVLVDVVVKNPLRDAANEQEKRIIWLYESFGLSLLCLLFYLVHHEPYLLMLLTLITFVYTQLVGRPDFANFLANLRAHWENHLQHEESMKQIERQKQQQQQLQQQALGMAGLNHSTAAELNSLSRQNIEHGYGLNFPFLNKQGSLHYPPNATVVPGQDRPTYSMSPNSASYRDAVKQSRGMYPIVGQNWNSTGNYSGTESQTMLSGMGRVQYDSGITSLQGVDSNEQRSLPSNLNLQRRSLRPDTGMKILPPPLTSSSIKSRFMNVIRFGSSTPKPVGLVNNGQNVCFINSVIQCLARSPFLVECLTADAAKELECSVAESELLSSLAELLDILTIDPSCSDYKVFSTTRFRKSASVLNPKLIAPPEEHMTQQDAAEFLMWLLATLHSILNKNRQALEYDSASKTNEDRFSSPQLANLKLIYGDLSANHIRELKDQCRREIAVANGLENESYAEAIHRLSDLEWLTHKQVNDTVIDGLFTGQLVEAYHSIEDGHISVNLQTFNILSVPIAPPRYNSGLVILEDCFTNFCNIEDLFQREPIAPTDVNKQGINVWKNPVMQISNFRRHKPINNRKERLGTPLSRQPFQAGLTGYMPSPIHHSTYPSPVTSHYLPTAPVISQTLAMTSPLLANSGNRDYLTNDSGFVDHTFRTSTPVGDNAVSRLKSNLQRRCLLRQLPECLIIQLMRFQYDQRARESTKITTSVSIRLRNFNLRDVIYDTVTHRNDLTAPSGGYLYELYGLCLHLGANDTSYGHYVSYCLDGDKWYRIDDQNVEEVNMEYQLSTEEIRQNVYLLFYRRMNSDSV